MTRRIEAGLSTRLSPFGPQWPTAKPGEARPVGQQVQQALFGRAKPRVLDLSELPQLAEQLRLLHKYRRKLAVMAGDREDDYEIAVADGTIAMIDAEGVIYVGAGFLAAFKERPEVLVGVLAHEIGHRPKRWRQYRSKRELTQRELEHICRHEETLADIFAGKALAEMGFDCAGLTDFLETVEVHPHPEYFPAKVRGELIREAYAGRRVHAEGRRKLFPEFERMKAPKGHLGEY